MFTCFAPTRVHAAEFASSITSLPGNKLEGKYRQVFVDQLNNKDFRVTSPPP